MCGEMPTPEGYANPREKTGTPARRASEWLFDKSNTSADGVREKPLAGASCWLNRPDCGLAAAELRLFLNGPAAPAAAAECDLHSQ